MKKRFLIITFTLSLLFVGCFGYFSSRVYVNAQETFATSGYILASSNDPESVNKQCYFSEGTKYKQSYTGNVSFSDINNDKVTVDSKVFVHYDNDALFGLNDSVIMDTDNINNDQISYYSITSDSVLSKQGNSYFTSNAGSQINFTNFIWKISPERYMIVSPEITLCVSEESQQTFNTYIELEYVDAGVAHLVNKEGTYSTVSSDAYLLLQNGIRVYIGSKNISTEEGIIMNLTQMVVNSDDNIEVVPDEEYTVEVDKQPHIIVNATDGESGEEGKQGNAGEAGDPGNPGAKGNQGSGGRGGTEGEKGDVGQDALYSGVTYVQQYIPHFALKEDLEVTAYGVDGLIDYTNVYAVETDASGNEIPKEIEMDTSGKTVDFMIVEQATSKIVWKRSINPQELVLYPGGTNYLTGSDNSPITTLKQNTDYALVINARFKPVKPVDFDDNSADSFYNQFITQQVLSQQFTTKGYGIFVTLDHTTSDAIYANLSIDKEAAELINSMDVGLYKEMLPTSELTCNNDYDLSIVSENDGLFAINSEGKISFTGIKDVSDDFEFPVVLTLEYRGHLANNLLRNYPYYLRINDVFLVSDQSLATYPTNGFDYVEAKTLKQTPVIGAPLLQISRDTNSLSVTPGYIEDIDSGIQKYRYEFYDVTTINGVKKYELAYTYDTTSTDIFTIPLNAEGSTEVNNNLFKGRIYCTKAVAIFDNNQTIEEVPSTLSNEVDTSSTYEWPTSWINFKTYPFGEYKDMTAPTFIDGEAYITDEQHLITQKSRIIINYEAINDTQSATFEEFKGKYVVENVDALDGSYKNGSYVIPFAFEALKSNTTYQISIEAEEMNLNGSISPNVTLCTKTIKTADYAPLLLSGKDINENTSADSFKVQLYFSLDNDSTNSHSYEYEEKSLLTLSKFGQDKLGLKNTYDLTAKSMTAVSFDVYSAKLDSSDGIIKPVSKLNVYPYVVTSPLEASGPIDYSINYYRNYADSNIFYTGAYATGLMNYLTLNPISDKQDVKNWLTSEYADYLVDFLKTDNNGENNTIGIIGKGTNFTRDDVLNQLNKTTTGDLYFSHIKPLIQNNFSNEKFKLDYSNLSNIGLPSTYTYSITLTDKSFNDAALKGKIEAFRSANQDNAYLLIKVNSAYDYTYGISDSTKVFNNPNLIKIGTNNSTCDGTIYDQYVVCGISNTIPSWDDADYFFKTPEKITKGYYYDKDNTNKLYEEVNTNSGKTMFSNLYSKEVDTYQITSSTRTAVTENWKKNVYTTTTTGIAIEGNSDWLSGYAKAVRYIVYDKDGNEVTRSYNNSSLTTKYYTGKVDDVYTVKTETYGEGGWLETSIGQPLPKWVFYFDQPYKVNTASEGEVPVYEDRYIRRGDEFKVVTQVLLKEVVEDSLNNIDYLYPRFDAIDGEGNPCVMEVTFSYIKQEPIINAYQYKGSAPPKDDVNAGNDIYYAIIKDTDNTILNATKNTSGDFVTFNFKAKETAESTELIDVNASISKLSLKDTKNANIPDIYELEFNSDYNTLYVEYKLENNDYPLRIDFANDNLVSSGDEVSFIKNIETGETDYSSKFREYIDYILSNYETLSQYNTYINNLLTSKELNSFIVIPKNDSYFQFYALLNPVNVDNIKKVEITFKNIDVNNKTKTFNFGISEFQRPNNESGIFIGPNTRYSDISEICNDSGMTIFDVSMKVYYETSNYGIYYTSVNDMQAQMGTDYNTSEHYYRYEPRKLSDGSPYDSGTLDIVNYNNAQEAYLIKTKEREAGEDFYEDVYSIGVGSLSGTTFNGFAQDINNTGLNFIPKEVKTVNLSAGYDVVVQYIKPTATISPSSPGMYFAKTNVELNTSGTLLKTLDRDEHQNETVEIVLTDTNNASNTFTEYVSIANGELNWNVEFNNLIPGTTYKVDVYGWLLINGIIDRYQLNTSSPKIKTLIELGVDEDSSYTEYTFETTSRADKGIDINVKLKDVYLSDIRKGVKESFIEVYEVDDYYDEWTPEAGVTKSKEAYYKAISTSKTALGTSGSISKVDMISIFEQQNRNEATAAGNTYTDGTSDYVAKKYVANTEIEWAPGASHVLDGTHKYVVFYGVTYGTTGSDEVLRIRYFKFNKNTKYGEKVSFRAIGSGLIDTHNSIDEFKVKFTISGTDSRRLLTGYNKVSVIEPKTDANNDLEYDVSYLVMLYKIDGNGNSVIVDIDGNENNDVYNLSCPDGSEHKVKIFDSKCFASSASSTTSGSYIEAKSFETAAEKNTEYFIKIYSVLDLENSDIEGINVGPTKLIHKVGTNDYYEFDGFDSDDVKNANKTGVYYANNTAYYVHISGRAKTPSSGSINVENVNMIPNINRIALYGTGLEKVDQVVYQLIAINADGSETPYDTVTFNLENGLDSKWSESTSGQFIYNLVVSEMANNIDRSYYIAIQLYTKEQVPGTDTYQYVLACSTEGNFVPEAQAPSGE